MSDSVADRRPLNAVTLRAALASRPLWRDIVVVPRTGSTNADLAVVARTGAAEGVVLTSDHQVAGRGRLTRTWEAPAFAGIAVSVLLRPTEVDRGRWSWLPLLAGLAVVDALETVGLTPRLKWPNDVLVVAHAELKVAGLLVELADEGRGAIVGIGVNVAQRADELPVPTATSVALAAGHPVDRETLLAALLSALASRYASWRRSVDDAATRQAYLSRSATIGTRVALTVPGGAAIAGDAVTVDRSGALVLRTAEGVRTFAAGDVVHLRPAAT